MLLPSIGLLTIPAFPFYHVFLRSSQIPSTAVAADAFSNYQIRDCHFDHLLQSAITITSDSKTFAQKRYTKRFRILGGVLVVDRCTFVNCSGNTRGGGSLIQTCFSITFSDCIFRSNSAVFAGGLYVVKSNTSSFARISFVKCTAEYMGACYHDGVADVSEPTANFSDLNFTSNRADEWTGAFRVEHGSGFVNHCIFYQNEATTCGAVFDYSWKPAKRHLSSTAFVNNSSKFRGGAFCAFHIMHLSEFTLCHFRANFCETAASSIYVESANAILDVIGCSFDDPMDRALGMRFAGSEINVDESSVFDSVTLVSVSVAKPNVE
jgi:hypothetical protein